MDKKDDHQQNSTLTAAASSLTCPSERGLRVPCYCEENVWRLAYRRTHSDNPADDGAYHVVFVSNETKCVPFFHQLASENSQQPCFWDYHVILLWTPDFSGEANQTQVLDVDSSLPYPSNLDDYLNHAFPIDFNGEHERYSPLFRVIPSKDFLENFCNDRMHMYNEERNEWVAPPPEYDCIQAESDRKSNLDDYICMKRPIRGAQKVSQHNMLGSVLTIDEMREQYGATRFVSARKS